MPQNISVFLTFCRKTTSENYTIKCKINSLLLMLLLLLLLLAAIRICYCCYLLEIYTNSCAATELTTN